MKPVILSWINATCFITFSIITRD